MSENCVNYIFKCYGNNNIISITDIQCPCKSIYSLKNLREKLKFSNAVF